MPPELTVLTLTLNEADSLGPFVERLRPAIAPVCPEYEFLVLDGGSSDGTADLARKLGARVVMQSAPGYGNAYRQGILEARGNYILTLDADSSHPMELFSEFWKRRADHAVVLGSRYLPGAGDTRPASRKLLSWTLNKAYKWLLGLPLTDISGGFRLYRADAAKAARTEGRHYDIVAEILVRIAFAGHKVCEIPYRYVPRVHGESKAQVLRFGLCYGITLFKLWCQKPKIRSS